MTLNRQVEDFIIPFETKTLLNLFKNNSFIIPPNQRPYSWSKDKWTELWEDLIDLYKERRPERTDSFFRHHFMGPMFFVESNNKFAVFDGQQRIVTMSLIVRLLFDLLNEIRDKSRISEGGAAMMGTLESILRDNAENLYIKRLILNSFNEQIFDYLLRSSENPFEKILSSRGTHHSEKEIIKCYKFF